MNFTSAMVPASPTSPTVSEKKIPHTQKDTTYTKIFVGGLPFHTTDQSLRKFFEDYGDIEEAVVITDRNHGRSKGYGFVTMATPEEAKEATKDPNPIIDGRKANVNLAFLGAKPRNNPTGNGLIDFRFLPPTAASRQAPTQALLQTPYGLPHPSQVYQSAVAPGYVMLQPALPYHPSLPNQTFYDLSAAYQQQLNANVAYEQYGGFTNAGYISPTLAYAVPQAGTLPASAAATYTQYQSTPQVAGDRMQ